MLKLVEEKQLLPAIVFSFARMECEAFAMNVWTEGEKSGKLDFTTAEEKASIEEVRTRGLVLRVAASHMSSSAVSKCNLLCAHIYMSNHRLLFDIAMRCQWHARAGCMML